MNAEWALVWATVALAMATIALAIVAAFQDTIRGWLLRPKLGVSIHLSPPDCHKTKFSVPRDMLTSGGASLMQAPGQEPTTYSADVYYLRLRITNTGNHVAETIEVFASELSKRQADGTFRPVDSFLPLNLLWSHFRRVDFPSISPDMYKHCDLAHIIKPSERDSISGENQTWANVSQDKTILSLDTAVRPYTFSYLIPFGTYHLNLTVGASNARPISRTLEIVLTGEWYDDEQTMFREGISIRTL